MKSEKGVTLTSLIVYIIAMVVVVGIVTTLTHYFYGNIDDLTARTNSSKEYTKFDSYFSKEINKENNTVKSVSEDGTEIEFSSGNQYTFLTNSDSGGHKDEYGAIYMNKILICNQVKNCKFEFNGKNKVTVTLSIGDDTHSNDYTLKASN